MEDASRAEAEATLEGIAARYDPSDPSEQFDYWLKRLQAQAIRRWLRGRRALELGCATGELSALIAPLVRDYHVVEGSTANVETARRRVPSATFTRSLWDDYSPDVQFSDVVACNAIEHAPEPLALLQRVGGWLEPDGRLHVVVPNGLSLHRLVGVELGMLPDPLHLTEGDRAQGHLRNYTIDSLTADVVAGGFRVVQWEGIYLKVLSNRQMLGWDWDLVRALHRVGQRFPEHAAELYVVAERA